MSPDESHILEWSDHDAGDTFGKIRKIVFRDAVQPFPILTFISVPKSTDAQWNSTSSKIILADAPDSEEPRVWLIRKNDDDRWIKERVHLFVGLRTKFAERGQDSAFNPLILDISWESDALVSFHIISKIGTFLIKVDTADMTVAPITMQISEHIKEPKNQNKGANKSEVATPGNPSDQF